MLNNCWKSWLLYQLHLYSLTVVCKCWGSPALFLSCGSFSFHQVSSARLLSTHRDTDPLCPDFAHFHASPLVLGAWFLPELLQLAPVAQPTSTEVPHLPTPKSIAYLVATGSFKLDHPTSMGNHHTKNEIQSPLHYLQYPLSLVLPNSLASSGAILIFVTTYWP